MLISLKAFKTTFSHWTDCSRVVSNLLVFLQASQPHKNPRRAHISWPINTILMFKTLECLHRLHAVKSCLMKLQGSQFNLSKYQRQVLQERMGGEERCITDT